MLTFEAIPSISEEVTAAFESLLNANAAVLKEFERVYEKRSKFHGVPEGRQDAIGLGYLLLELLSSDYKLPSSIDRASQHFQSKFSGQIATAVRIASEHEPTAFLTFKANQLEKGCTAEQAIAGILTTYIRRENVLPY